MLGGYIDCDNKQGEGGSHDDGDGEGGGACSRWMMWAAVSFFLLLVYFVGAAVSFAHFFFSF